MNELTTLLLGAIAGLTIFIGLPVARLRSVSRRVQGFLAVVATGILFFLLWDVLTEATEPVERALDEVHKGQIAEFAALSVAFALGITIGLLALVWFNHRFAGRLHRRRPSSLEGPGAAVAGDSADPARRVLVPGGRSLAMMIAVGLGLHNFSEGLAIGQAAVSGALTFAAVLIVGFGLHNITEGFGIAAPATSDTQRPSWGFLLLAGVIGGGPTFLGTLVGYSFDSPFVFVLFLALAAGALLYVINEMLQLGRRLSGPGALAAGLLLGFLIAYGTDLLLTYAGG